jgi:hypothetical protein
MGLKETTIKELAALAIKEMSDSGIRCVMVAAACDVSEPTVKNALLIKTVPAAVRPDTYIRIMAHLGFHVEITYSPDMVQYFYKKLKKAK